MLISFEPRYQFHMRKLSFNAITTKLLSSSSSPSPDDYKLKQDNVGSCYNVTYDLFFDDPECVRDDLSYFRGLVLDVSYRSVL